jgi:D-cysteine desulfhydrase family pyridoxal phosphate-dependent enzyme
MELDNLDRIKLALLPTPLHKLTGLSKYLGGPNIYIKRDDLTGLGLGGNKIRKLEFVLADAKNQKADIVLTTGGEQSNHCMLTAMAARKVGMKASLFLRSTNPVTYKGNLILSNLVSEIFFLALDKKLISQAMEEKAEEFRRKGKIPYIIPLGASVPLGAVGYYLAYHEIIEQALKFEVSPTHIVIAWGSGGTHAGLQAGAINSTCKAEIVGVNVDDPNLIEEIKKTTAELTSATLSEIGYQGDLTTCNINIFNDYSGAEGYGKPSEAGMEAIKLVANTEGILLDPIYTGKAMAGLIDKIKKGYFNKDDQVVFIHTGGAGSIFAFAEKYLSLKR